jgi:hypothetical protein
MPESGGLKRVLSVRIGAWRGLEASEGKEYEAAFLG